jgi:prepilin-type processing-associated H-X9-DG protein
MNNRKTPSTPSVISEAFTSSINGSWMTTFVTNPNNWEDLPASYHNGAGGISFADGHAEMHKWIDITTKAPVQYLPPTPLPNGVAWPAPGSRDSAWMIEHARAQIR